jgi:hypothetical protein
MVGEGNADLLAGWEIENVVVDDVSAGAPYVWAATASDTAHVQAWLSLGAGVNPSTTASQYGFKVGGDDAQTSLAGAIAANHYMEISLVAEAGYELDLMSLEMNGESTGSGADNIALLSSIDGYADGSEIAQLSGLQTAGTGGWDTDASGWGAPFDFSGDAGYQGISAVSFRIYGWNTSSGSGVSYLRSLSGNDVEVTGATQAVPEPAVIGLICFAGTAALISRRFIV